MEGKRPVGGCIGMREITAREGETDFLKRRKGPSDNAMRVGTNCLDYTVIISQ